MEKRLDENNLQGLIELLKSNNQKIVFTNGCFDLLHPGHIAYLKSARKEGDVLIVGVNSDASVRKLKGKTRPINNLNDRLTMLEALECIDFVISFEDETPLDLIKKIGPHVLIKGGDYEIENIVGSDFVIEAGGSVKVIDFLSGYSSTTLIEKIIKNS